MGFEALRNGEFILVYDDDDREGEVDMTIASEFVTPKSVATMRDNAGGLIWQLFSSHSTVMLLIYHL